MGNVYPSLESMIGHTPLMALALMTLVSGAGALFLLRRRHG